MGKFQPKRRIDHAGKRRNNYYKKGRTKYTEGHIHDQIGIGVTIIATIIGIWWGIDSLIGNQFIGSIITLMTIAILCFGIRYYHKKF